MPETFNADLRMALPQFLDFKDTFRLLFESPVLKDFTPWVLAHDAGGCALLADDSNVAGYEKWVIKLTLRSPEDEDEPSEFTINHDQFVTGLFRLIKSGDDLEVTARVLGAMIEPADATRIIGPDDMELIIQYAIFEMIVY